MFEFICFIYVSKNDVLRNCDIIDNIKDILHFFISVFLKNTLSFIFILNSVNCSSAREADIGWFNDTVYFNDKGNILNNFKINIEKARKCIHLGLITNHLYPADANDHYEYLLKITKQYRSNVSMHSYKGYDGPWIENAFINSFISKPLKEFGGFFPLFVQWSDYKNLHKSYSTDVSMFDALKHVLRSDVIYLAVSQANHGLAVFKEYRPNILVLSAGGVGNIAIPLLKKELDYIDFNISEFKYHIGKYCW